MHKALLTEAAAEREKDVVTTSRRSRIFPLFLLFLFWRQAGRLARHWLRDDAAVPKRDPSLRLNDATTTSLE